MHETELSGVIAWLVEWVMTEGHVPGVTVGEAVAVGVTVAVGETVGEGGGVTVAVGLGGGLPHGPLKMSEKARTVPTSPPAASIAVKVQVPSAFCPSKADNGLFPLKVPVNGPASVPPGH